jgi:hypothetical protein
VQWIAFAHSSTSDAFTCGHCRALTTTAQRFALFQGAHQQPDAQVAILVCTACWRPNYFEGHRQVPAPPVGAGPVEHLPDHVLSNYREAIASQGAGAPTGAAILCRKILMNVAVHKGAAPNLHFVDYVDYLVNNHYVPPGSTDWVKHIKDRGNEATHEIEPVTSTDAIELLEFTESLLRYVFELPGKMRARRSQTSKKK